MLVFTATRIIAAKHVLRLRRRAQTAASMSILHDTGRIVAAAFDCFKAAITIHEIKAIILR